MCNNDNSIKHEGNISIENCTDLIVEAKISGYVDGMLFDSGTEISLLDEQLRKRCKNHFIQRIRKLRNKCQDIGVRMCSFVNMSIQV